MNDQVMNQFAELTYNEQAMTLGGGWPGAGLIHEIYKVGYKTGRALAKWF